MTVLDRAKECASESGCMPVRKGNIAVLASRPESVMPRFGNSLIFSVQESTCIPRA